MQISPLGAGDSVRDRGLDRAGPVAANTADTSVALSASRAITPAPRTDAGASTLAPSRSGRPLAQAGVSVWNPQLNGQVASAQQALQYLDRLSTRLHNLKSDLGSAVAGAPVPPERLERQRQMLSQLWNARTEQAGGQLDNRLRYTDNTPATQAFAVPGLTIAAMQAGERETLAIAVGTPSPARPAAVVVLEPGLDPRALVRRFDQALAPLGVSASANTGTGAETTDGVVSDAAAPQALRLTVPESAWPGVRDNLSIRGEGRRFPGGPFHRVRTQAEPAAIEPDTWSLQSGPGGRQTLQRIVEAQGQVARAGDTVRGVLQQAGRALDAADTAQDAAWATRYAASFEAATRPVTNPPNANRYGPAAARSHVGAALQPLVSRQRVVTLLSQDR